MSTDGPRLSYTCSLFSFTVSKFVQIRIFYFDHTCWAVTIMSHLLFMMSYQRRYWPWPMLCILWLVTMWISQKLISHLNYRVIKAFAWTTAQQSQSFSDTWQWTVHSDYVAWSVYLHCFSTMQMILSYHQWTNQSMSKLDFSSFNSDQ